nr:uncharacterized protein LOC129267396 [Lytechinus pictus]
MKFIDKFFESNQLTKRVLKEYLESEPIISELITTPLFCTMVCCMWREDRLKGTYTKSSFFDTIMNFLLKHAKAKAILPKSVDLDDLLYHVGGVAFDKLSEGGDESSLLFTHDDFMNVISHKETSLQLGLLTTAMALDEDLILFIEFFHKLALEYSTGKYFAFAAFKGKMGAWRGKTILELGIFQVLEFAAGASESACEKILGYIAEECSLRRSSVCGSQSYQEMILSLISEAENMCAENMIEATSPSLFGLNGTLYLGCPKASAVVGFGKLPQHVKNKIIEVSVDVSDWTTSIFKKLWGNFANCSRLSHLKLSFHTPPTIPNDEEKLYTVKRFTISLPIQPSGMKPMKSHSFKRRINTPSSRRPSSPQPQDLDPSLLEDLFDMIEESPPAKAKNKEEEEERAAFNWRTPDVPTLEDISQVVDRMSTYISRFASHVHRGSSQRNNFRSLHSGPVAGKPVKGIQNESGFV